MEQSAGPTRARELELTIAQLCKHQFAQKSVQQTELLGKEFGENINFKELLWEETEEHITNPKLAQEEMAENLTIPQLHRKENEKNFADELPKLEDQKSQQKLEAIVGYQASIFELLALGSQELAEHIATVGKNRAKLAVEKFFRAHAYKLVKISFGDSELAAKIRTEKNFQLRIRHRFRDRQLAHSLDPMTFHIRSLDPMTFHIRSLDPMSFHIRSLDNSSLSTKALDSTNFQDDSLTEETFTQATSETAAWKTKKRPSPTPA